MEKNGTDKLCIQLQFVLQSFVEFVFKPVSLECFSNVCYPHLIIMSQRDKCQAGSYNFVVCCLVFLLSNLFTLKRHSIISFKRKIFSSSDFCDLSPAPCQSILCSVSLGFCDVIVLISVPIFLLLSNVCLKFANYMS